MCTGENPGGISNFTQPFESSIYVDYFEIQTGFSHVHRTKTSCFKFWVQEGCFYQNHNNFNNNQK